MFSTAGCTDTKVFDTQGAIEAATSIHSAALSGANFIHDVGYFESGITGSALQLVLGDELIGMSHVVARGVEVDAEALAVEEICQAGPGGAYAGRSHTRKYADKLWQPTLMDRQSFEEWDRQGRQWMQERVVKKVQEIDKNYAGPVSNVPKETKEAIAAILAAAEEREAKKAKEKV
jgi:trimethylamine--corrinoid protein Co-methyltransferase